MVEPLAVGPLRAVLAAQVVVALEAQDAEALPLAVAVVAVVPGVLAVFNHARPLLEGPVLEVGVLARAQVLEVVAEARAGRAAAHAALMGAAVSKESVRRLPQTVVGSVPRLPAWALTL